MTERRSRPAEEDDDEDNTLSLAAMEEQVYVHVRPELGPGLNPAAPCAGALAPQPALADGTLMDYKVGYNFALVGSEDIISGLSERAKAALPSLGAVVLPDSSETVINALNELGGRAMLVRPDHYLAGVASTSDEMSEIIIAMQSSLA